MRLIFFITFILIFISQFVFSQNDSIQKTWDKEEKRFQKDLKKNHDNAGPYWRHANILSTFKGKFAKDAFQFYGKAIKIDSLNAELYKDYGRYMSKIIKNASAARNILQKSFALNSADPETKVLLDEVTVITDKQEKKNKMKDIGISNVREFQTEINYASLTNFDSLKILLADSTKKSSYKNILLKFLNDDKNITYHEMYLLLVGYSMLKDYKSLNYNDIRDLQGMANSEHYDGAIEYALKLLQENPLNPSVYKELMFCYRMKDDSISANKYLNRLKLVFNGMIYSGNGTCERPYINLWSKEKQNFIQYLGLMPTDNFNILTCAGHMAEVVDVKDSVTNKNGNIYFNISLISKNIIGK